VQAGQDLGLPQDRLDWYVGYIMDREKEHAGGVTQLSEKLIERQTSSLERRELVAEDLYSETWSQIITGEQAGTLGRPTSDRFVRPGLLAFLHRRLLADPEGYTAFGGVSPSVSLQFLIIDPKRDGGLEAGRAYAEEVRSLALNGEDFTALVERDGAVKGKDASLQIYEPRLALSEPELAEHIARLAAGEITPVVKLTTLLEVPAWAVVRLVERIAAIPPDFTLPLVQQRLHGYAQDAFDAQRLENARGDLYRSAYVWPPELSGR
jgi:hypothetical protein